MEALTPVLENSPVFCPENPQGQRAQSMGHKESNPDERRTTGFKGTASALPAPWVFPTLQPLIFNLSNKLHFWLRLVACNWVAEPGNQKPRLLNLCSYPSSAIYNYVMLDKLPNLTKDVFLPTKWG